jgi:hypothetical protein
MAQTQLIDRSRIDSDAWDKFISENTSGIIYFKSWYLDVVAPGWSAIISKKDQKWCAVMPVYIQSKGFFKYSIQPQFSRYLGILFSAEISKSDKKFSIYKTITNEIINLIPENISLFDYNFHKDFSYFLPFQWKSYSVKIKISHFIPLKTFDIYSISSSIKNHLKKAETIGLKLEKSHDIEPLISLSIGRRIMNNTAALIFRKLWAEISRFNAGSIIYAKDEEGNIHGGAAIVYDGETASLIHSLVDSKLKRSGANSLLLFEIISKLKIDKIYKYFYFEGSMHENVEAFILGFRPEIITYYSISKNKIPLLTGAWKLFNS